MERDLTQGSVFRNILSFSLPYLLSYFLQTLYGMADLFIIGQFEGVASTTAVSVGSQVMHMLTLMIVGLAMGSTVSIGQAVGAGMVRAAELGISLGLTPAHLSGSIARLVEAFGLPTSLPCPHDQYAAAIGLDKKGAGDSISLILLDRPGHALAYPIAKQQLLAML